MAERRSLYDMIFGKNPKTINNQTQLKMLSGFHPQFSMFGSEAYDSDIVRAAVDSIARHAAKLKPKHVRRVNGQVLPSNSTLERLLQVRPNPFMDAYSFYYKVVTLLYMRNNAFIFINKDSVGNVLGFYPVDASSVELVEAAGQVFAKFKFMGGQQITLPYEELIHLRRFFYKNDIFGETSERALLPTLELIQTTNDGIANAVKSSAYLRGLLKFTNTMIKPEEIKRQRDLFVTDYLDVTNNGGIAAIDAKAEYQELKNNPMMIDSNQMNAIEEKIYKFYNVNKDIIMSSYNEDTWNAFYESVLEPIAIQLSLEFTSKLFTDRERGFGNEIVFEANRLQYASNRTKIELVKELTSLGLLSLNEAREVFNLSAIEDGDKRIVSLNYVDASLANQYQLGGVSNGNQQ